jgi:hypothetical protein
MAKRKSVGAVEIPLDDPDLPAMLEFKAARRAGAGDLNEAQKIRDHAIEIRAAQKQAESEAPAESGDESSEASESGVHS